MLVNKTSHKFTGKIGQKVDKTKWGHNYKIILFKNFLQHASIKVLYQVSQKNILKLIFEFLSLRGVFLGVQNNSKIFGNKKNIRLFKKFLSKWTLLHSNSFNFLEFL